MAVPSSGLIKFSGIAAELVNDDYTDADFDDTLTLKDMTVGGNANGSSENFESINSNSEYKPDSSTPYKMSEFYGYDHDAAGSSLTSFPSSVAQSKNPCGFSNSNLNSTWYHDGSNAYPVVNDNAYSDDTGDEALLAGQYKIGPFNGTYRRITVNSSGVVTVSATCG